MYAFAMAGPAVADETTSLEVMAVQFALSAVTMFLFVPRICSRPYRGFSLVLVEISTGEATNDLDGAPRLRIAFFLWWRQVLAGMFASLLAMPLNAVLLLMGLKVTQWVVALAGVLVIGPILLKMLIGNDFEGFRVEARRGASSPAKTQAAAS